MAYAAVICLKNTFHRLLSSSRVSLAPVSPKTIGLAYKELVELQKTLMNMSSKKSERVKALEGQVREEVYKLEDLIESRIVSPSECLGDEGCSEELGQEIVRFRKMAKKMVKKMEKERTKELCTPFPEEEEEDVASRADFGRKKSKMVGLSDQFGEIKDKVLDGAYYIKAFALVGMAGIGKTTLAHEILEDPSMVRDFECHAFVKVGQKHRLAKMLRDILDQVNPNNDEIHTEGNVDLDEYLWKSLIGRRYLIVLDDVWSTDFWDELLKGLPQENNGSRVLLTTRLDHVALSLTMHNTFQIRFLNEKESRDLLREKVFVEGLSFSQLEKAGRKIAKNCEGLPLLILAVADLLSKAENTLEYWNEVAEDKENPIFMDAYEQISNVLYPSFHYLPQQLKVCFLYMAAFPRNYEMGHQRLVNLWIAEGFLEPKPSQSIEEFGVECFEKLLSCNVVVVREQSLFRSRVKSCSLHFVYWILSKKEAGNEKFLHILRRYADAEGMESERRLSIYSNTLFGIKDVYDSIATISTVHSLLCPGPYHQYQVPLCFDLRFLRVLDALTIRFYEFPIEVLKLVQLRYLALTCNKNLPHSISKLWKLQYMIFHPHLSIRSTVVESYLPVEIWDLQELKCLEIPGRKLPNPCGSILPNLLQLLGVDICSCTNSVLESIPNLNKLRVQIELAPNTTELLSYIDNIPHVHKLRSLKCVVVNPILTPEVIPSLVPLQINTHSLKRLTLNGFGYPWKYMSKIAKLPVLQVLKLQCYAFRGEHWEAEEVHFAKLKYLSIEDTDLVQWTVGDETFPLLWLLRMENCYKIRVIPKISSLRKLVLVDCNTSAMTRAEQNVSDRCRVHAHSTR